jgi:uncharacterized protein
MQKAGVLTMCVQHEDFPYKYVSVEGTVVQADQPLPEELAQRFVGAELSNPESQLVLYTIRPDRWLSTDFSDDMG